MHVTCVRILFFTIFTLVRSQKLTREEEETDLNDVQLPGQIMLGGLFPIHEDGSAEMRHCGMIKPDKGIQRMEAMLFAIDEINRNATLLPNLKLGAHILDTCNQDTHGLEQTLKFIKNSLSQDNMKYYQCPKNVNIDMPKPVSAVIGAASSQVSSMVANVLRLFKIPQISYSSTSPELSDKSRFEYFTRVVPPDTLQAQAMVDVVKKIGWTFVSVVYDEGSYGEQGFEAFQKHAKEKELCIAMSEKLKRDFKDDDYKRVIRELKKQKGRGVVLFVNEDNVKKILKAVNQLDFGAHFAWVASDNWGNKRSAVQDNPSDAIGAITIQPKVKTNEAFDEYFKRLKPMNRTRPYKWFNEFWMHRFNCTTLNAACLNKSLSENHVQESYVPFVVDAVFLAAHALSRYFHDHCGTLPFNVCINITRPEGHELLQYIRNTSFVGMQDEEVRLNQDGDRMIKYKIYQYRGYELQYIDVGEWVSKTMPNKGRLTSTTEEIRELTLNVSLIQSGYVLGVIPESKCGRKCAKNEYKSSTHIPCCWDCLFCNESSINNETSCTNCQLGFKPNTFKNECIVNPPDTMEWHSPFALVPACFSAIGIVATIFVVVVFVKHNKTPVIMASGRELCYIMLCGIFSCYAMTFFLLQPPTAVVCGVLRMGLGLCLCIIYAAIFTKTSRLSRIFTSDVRAIQRPRFISPRAQVVICCLLISIQLIGGAIWLIVDNPNTQSVYPDRLTVVLSCAVTPQPMLLSLTYIALLITLCTIYAFKTRKIPENFNETKHIGFTMYATCIIWLAFIPIYFGTNNNFRVQTTSLCMCLSLSGTVALCCFFAPKLYIVLFQPDKNVRNHTMSGFQKMQIGMVQQQMRFLSRPSATGPAPITSTIVSQNVDTMNTTSLLSMKSNDSPNGEVPVDEYRPKIEPNPSTVVSRSDSRSRPVTYVPSVYAKDKNVFANVNYYDEKQSPTENTPILASAKNTDTSALIDAKSIKSKGSDRDGSPDSYTEPVRLRRNVLQHQQSSQGADWMLVDPHSEFESIISDISSQKGTFV